MLGTDARPLRVAIIGAGPAGFYAAESLLKRKDLVCSIDIFNRLPTPFGLVRDGVAPDHQSIKAVVRIYDKIASNAQVRYFGNVTFGQDIRLADMQPYYDQIVYAVGAETDRRLGIPGEDLGGSYPATAFVGWYNGHPDYREHTFDLSHERVVVVGNGNVAMDVARILVTDPDDLAKTDIADHALEALRTSSVREVIMLGRRGPAQAAFTNPELKEFGELRGVQVVVEPAEVELDAQSEAALADDKRAQRNVAMLRDYVAQGNTDSPRRIVMRFLVSPVEIIGADEHMTAVKIERNQLVQRPDGSMRPQGTGEYETFPAGMILRSVGYRGVPLTDVPFNDNDGTIANVAGRVVQAEDGTVVPGQYVVGWAKRGPSGVIGTNKPDAVKTVDAMLEDVATLPGIDDANRDPQHIVTLLDSRKPDYITYEDWRKLDTHELMAGEPAGRPRVKVTRVPDMLDIIRS